MIELIGRENHPQLHSGLSEQLVPFHWSPAIRLVEPASSAVLGLSEVLTVNSVTAVLVDSLTDRS